MSLAVFKVNKNNSKLSNPTLFKIFSFLETFLNRRSLEIQGTALGKCLQA